MPGDLWYPQPLEYDFETTLILAGDLWVGNKSEELEDWLIELSKRFKYVLVVLGNHDYYYTEWKTAVSTLKLGLNLKGCDNVIVLEDDSVTIEGITFVGSTFWTDMKKEDPLVVHCAQRYMGSDFSRISLNASTPWTPKDWLEKHWRSFLYIRHIVETHEKVVVITHHGPSMIMADPSWTTAGGDDYFFSEYGDWIAGCENLLYWFHGHTHQNRQERIGNCNMVVNAVGYYHERAVRQISHQVFEIE